ncbi:MAG: HAD family hydrolase [Rothia sp. (in: high G+C Gram-positive bacteria)]|nr:HAD family hydrolase [Rothia sp. (in: high G+C Gram-positive bacteria)]
MTPELIIFDCDGVLVDSEVLAVDIDRQVFAEYGWDLTRDEVIERFLGTPMRTMQEQLEARLGRSLGEEWLDALEARYAQVFEKELVAVPGVIDLLEQLDTPRCVASSGTHQRIRHSLKLCNMSTYFEDEHIFSAQDVRRGKPAPDLFLHAASAMGAAPQQCVVIEDSAHGVSAARAAGMRVLGYAGGVTPARTLQDAGAQVFESMAQVPGLLAAS